MVTQDQLDSSIVEIVDQEEPALKLGIRKVCYLPYHEVVHLDKSTTKVRVVLTHLVQEGLTILFMLVRHALH